MKKDKLIKIKSLKYATKSYNVYEGLFDNRIVTIKEYDKKDMRGYNEINIIQRLQRSNVIKYFCKEESKNKLRVVLEKTKNIDKMLTKDEMYQIVKLIYYMHSCNIVHNNLSISSLGINNLGFVVLMDFEDSRILEDEIETKMNEKQDKNETRTDRNKKSTTFISSKSSIMDYNNETNIDNEVLKHGAVKARTDEKDSNVEKSIFEFDKATINNKKRENNATNTQVNKISQNTIRYSINDILVHAKKTNKKINVIAQK
ncbi:hypothetical protein BDAP_000710 [Binucleata daphniae]